MTAKHCFDDSASKRFDLAARQAAVVGKAPRIAPVDIDQLGAEGKKLVLEVRATLGLDTAEVPDVFRVMLRHPGVFKYQMEMGVELLGRGDLPARERELAILRVAWWCGAPYEWGEHVEIAKRVGVTDEEIERLTQGSTATGWGRHDKAVLSAVEELLTQQMIAEETWKALSQSWSERQLIELPFVVGQYFSLALQKNSLKLPLGGNNQGLKHR